jgi:hypothetical protein
LVDGPIECDFERRFPGWERGPSSIISPAACERFLALKGGSALVQKSGESVKAPNVLETGTILQRNPIQERLEFPP